MKRSHCRSSVCFKLREMCKISLPGYLRGLSSHRRDSSRIPQGLLRRFKLIRDHVAVASVNRDRSPFGKVEGNLAGPVDDLNGRQQERMANAWFVEGVRVVEIRWSSALRRPFSTRYWISTIVMAETNMGSPAVVALSMAAVAAREIRASAVKYQRIAWVSARTAAIRCLPLGSSSTFRAGLHRCPQPKRKSLGQQGYPLCFEMAFSGPPRPGAAWRGSRSLVACRMGATVPRREWPVQPTCGPLPQYHESGWQFRWSVVRATNLGVGPSELQLQRCLPGRERNIFVLGTEAMNDA